MSIVLLHSHILRRVSFVVGATIVALVTGCRHATPAVSSQSAAVETLPPSSPETPGSSATGAPRNAEPVSSDAGELERRSRVRATLEQIVYFQFDQSELDASARALLDAKAEILRADRTVALRIDGHADDRGSDEYNIALAMGRASAIKRYLADRGVSADRLETVSFGEERPACSAPNEACWSKNRRAEFTVRGGE